MEIAKMISRKTRRDRIRNENIKETCQITDTYNQNCKNE